MSELLVILVVALLFLGPDKLPDAAKKLSRGIREFRQQGRELQRTIQDDTELGAAVRDLKSALRGDDFRPVPYRQDQNDQDQDDKDEDNSEPPGGSQPVPDPYKLASNRSAPDDDDLDDDRDPRGAAESDGAADDSATPTTARAAASPVPAAVPVEVESTRRGASTSDPDGSAHG